MNAGEATNVQESLFAISDEDAPAAETADAEVAETPEDEAPAAEAVETEDGDGSADENGAA